MKLNYFHRRLYYKSEIDETTYSAEVWERKEKLEYFAQLKAEGCSQETALKVLGLSKSRYYLWEKSLSN